MPETAQAAEHTQIKKIAQVQNLIKALANGQTGDSADLAKLVLELILEGAANEALGPYLLTIDEVIENCRTSRATLYREIKSGRLKSVKLNRRRYLRPADIEEWIEQLVDEARP